MNNTESQTLTLQYFVSPFNNIFKFIFVQWTYNFFSEYLERYLYSEDDIDEADIDKYEKVEPSFMDYDVSDVYRDVKNSLSF